MVRGLVDSDAASMWHCPSKIPPSNFPAMATWLPSIWPSTRADSPSTRLWEEITFPFTCASMRNTPEASRVPSNRTPLSRKPVNSCRCGSLVRSFDRHCTRLLQMEADDLREARFYPREARVSREISTAGRNVELAAGSHTTYVILCRQPIVQCV